MRVAVASLIAFALGLLLGRAWTPAPTAAPPAPKAEPSPGPTRKVAGVGVGFARTRAGAALAAASYQEAFATPEALARGALKRRIKAIATPDFAPVMLRANRPGAERLARGGFGAGLRAGLPSVFLGVPVGYRILSYSPRRAVVRTWGFTLLGNSGAIEPSAYFGLARTVLRWQRGDWKIANTQASFGPTPHLATPHRGGEGTDLIELSEELRRYGVAP